VYGSPYKLIFGDHQLMLFVFCSIC